MHPLSSENSMELIDITKKLSQVDIKAQAPLTSATGDMIPQSMPTSPTATNVVDLLNESFNVLGSLAAIGIGAYGLSQLWQSKRQDKQKKVVHLANVALGTQLLGTGTASFLAKQEIVTGAVASTLMPMGGFGFATFMWGLAIQSALHLHRALKKTKPIHLIYDRVKKVECLDKKIQHQQERLSGTSDQQKRKKHQKRLAKLAKAKHRASIDACSLIKVHHQALVKHKKYHKLKLKCIKLHINAFDEHGNPILASRADKIKAAKLATKQARNVKKYAKATLTDTLAAIGSTITALSFLCPPLLLPGAALYATSLVLKWDEVANTVCEWIVRREEKADYVKSIKTKTIESIKNSRLFNNPDISSLSPKQRVNMIMAYHLTCDEVAADNPQPSFMQFVAQLEKDLTRQKKDLKQFLKSARKKYLAREISLKLDWGNDKTAAKTFSQYSNVRLFSRPRVIADTKSEDKIESTMTPRKQG